MLTHKTKNPCVFSRTMVEANADKTKNVVETGIPTLVSTNNIPGATA